MYGITGEHDLSERELPHLRGWRDSAPVRVGNGAWGQTQLDVYGELLDTLLPVPGAARRAAPRDPGVRRRPGRRRRRGLDGARTPACGRCAGSRCHHLSSKVLCWTALDRAVKLAPAGRYAKAEAWAEERDASGRRYSTRGWSEKRQAYAQSFDSDELDAAALLMPLVGFLPADDTRMRSTIEAIARDLTEDGLVLRYRNEEGLNADGLEGEEGTFVICSFWLVSALRMAGEVDRAQELFDRLTGSANDLGLLAEEIDTAKASCSATSRRPSATSG